MNCPDFNWKDYVLGEASGADRAGIEEHLAGCEDCRREVEALTQTVATMRRLPDRELPRRIAFVSDPVFEPSWWQRFWASGARLAFASSAMLSVALVAHAVIPRVSPPTPVAMSETQVEERVQRELAKRLPGAVRDTVRTELQPALNELSARIDQMDDKRLAGIERRVEEQRKSDLRNVESAFNYIEKRINTLMTSNVKYGGD